MLQTTALLAAVSGGAVAGISVAVLFAGLILGFLATNFLLKNKAEKNKQSARKILEDAYNEVKTIKKEALLEAKEEVHKLKMQCDIEVQERRSEIQKHEDRLVNKEESIERDKQSVEREKQSVEQIKTNNEELRKKLEKENKDAEEKHTEIVKKLEEVSKLTKDQAKKQIIEAVTDEAKKDAARMVREIEENAKEDANKVAKEIISGAIQRCAADHTSEVTVSVVPLPNDEVKGRIIGREGRNIRALEAATGIDLIIDDTPEAITLSSFDPYRREVARIALEKLVLDGRIHPTRIEEIVEKVRKDLDTTIKEAGELVIEESGLVNFHPEIVKTLGRLKYRTSYGQNVLKHSLEVSLLAGLMAAEIGANINIAKRGGLLHDIGKAMDHEKEGTHTALGVEFARKFKENEAVIHCIEAHHGDVPFKSIEAILVQAADAISSSRPGARRESLENYIKRLKQLEEIANGFKGVEKSFAIQAGREIRIIVKPEEVSEETAIFMAKDIARKIEDNMEYPGQIKVNVIRETRSTEYAK